MRVSKATEDDLLAIESIEGECFGLEAWTRDMIKSDFNVRSLYQVVRTDEDDIAGYASLLLLDTEAELLRIAVRKRYRKKGYGKALMSAIIGLCEDKGFEKLYLEVKDSNEPAMSLYKAFGFCEVARRKEYYKDGADAVIMSRIL